MRRFATRLFVGLHLVVALFLMRLVVCRWLGFSEAQLEIMLGNQPKPDYKLIAQLELELFPPLPPPRRAPITRPLYLDLDVWEAVDLTYTGAAPELLKIFTGPNAHHDAEAFARARGNVGLRQQPRTSE